MRVRVRTLGTALAIVAMVSLALGLSACASQAPEEEATSPTANDPAVSPPAEGETPPAEAPSDEVMVGAMGTAEKIGSWTVTVREAETGSGNDDVATPPGSQRLKIEVDLRNDGDSTMTVRSGDWTLVSGDVALQVLASDEPEKRGERPIDAGETEDVTVNFALPDEGRAWSLRFQPSEGGPGILEVPIP